MEIVPPFKNIINPWQIHQNRFSEVVAFKTEDPYYETEKACTKDGLSFAKVDYQIIDTEPCQIETNVRLFMRQGEVVLNKEHPVKDLRQNKEGQEPAKSLFMRSVTKAEQEFVEQKEKEGEGYFLPEVSL